MASRSKKDSDDTTEMVRTLVIVQLGLANVPRRNIRAIAACDMNRVSRILKHLKVKAKKG